ncbi:MAG: CvpA family protein, partial [Pirellulaceae bacterium]
MLCFLMVFVAVRFVGFLLAKGLKATGLGGVDRLAGGLFGLARAGLLVV